MWEMQFIQKDCHDQICFQQWRLAERNYTVLYQSPLHENTVFIQACLYSPKCKKVAQCTTMMDLISSVWKSIFQEVSESRCLTWESLILIIWRNSHQLSSHIILVQAVDFKFTQASVTQYKQL